jgi:hypothetical protein
MAGKSPMAATDDQRAALKVMSRAADRAEADRARAVWGDLKALHLAHQTFIDPTLSNQLSIVPSPP